MTELPLLSSDRIIRALERGGFELARKSRGSHQALKRQRPDGGHDVTIVTLGKSEVPKGTLNHILKLANVSRDEFLDWT